MIKIKHTNGEHLIMPHSFEGMNLDGVKVVVYFSGQSMNYNHPTEEHAKKLYDSILEQLEECYKQYPALKRVK